MSKGMLEKGWRGLPWVFLRSISPASPRGMGCRAAGYYELTRDGLLRVPYEVVHAPGFAMWATPAMRSRLSHILPRPSVLSHAFLQAPGVIYGRDGVPRSVMHWVDELPTQVSRRLETRPCAEADFGTNVIALSPSNEKLGSCSVGAYFHFAVQEARRPQPAPVRLALLINLIASVFEDPERVWFVDEQSGEAGFDRVIPRWSEISSHYRDSEIRLRKAVLRLAILKALPGILNADPQINAPDLAREACRRLAEVVTEELFPAKADPRTGVLADGRVVPFTDGKRETFTRELLAWPGPSRGLVFEQAGEPARKRTLRLLHSLIRARLTPDQMCAVLMQLWGIEPFDRAEGRRLTVHLSRARARIRDGVT
jgi:hypothetical protein